MAQPTSYTPAADFSDDELTNVGGRSTVRTAGLDAEFAAIDTTLDVVLTNLSLNQRDDGEIRDGRVKLHTLAASVAALLTTGNITASATGETSTRPCPIAAAAASVPTGCFISRKRARCCSPFAILTPTDRLPSAATARAAPRGWRGSPASCAVKNFSSAPPPATCRPK